MGKSKKKEADKEAEIKVDDNLSQEEVVETNELENKVKELEDSLSQEKEKSLRSFAELENFKKRKEQEMRNFCKFANEELVLSLLPVLDSFDRACEHAEGAEDNTNIEDVISGFVLIQKQFHAALEKLGIKTIEAVGQPFNTDEHQAIMQEDSDEVDSNTVVKEVQKGYKLNERTIRPAMVIVSK
jgi:molecular chaperone GrpE